MDTFWIKAFVMTLAICAVSAKLVDLSYQYDAHTLNYPVHPPFRLQVMQRGWKAQQDGQAWIEYNKFSTAEHLGTHIDAPAHFSSGPGKWRLHEIPIERFVGDAVVIDISSRSDLTENPDNKLMVSDITDWETEHGQIKDDSIVFVNSGWGQYWGDKLKYMGSLSNDTSEYHWPGISKVAAEWLVNNRQISGVGTDTMGFDSGDNFGNHPAHVTLLSENIYGLENVNNLGQMPASGARVYVFPMNIRDGSGAPCRVIAEFGEGTPFNRVNIMEPSLPILLFMLVLVFISTKQLK